MLIDHAAGIYVPIARAAGISEPIARAAGILVPQVLPRRRISSSIRLRGA